MAIVVTKSTYKSNPMPEGLNQAVIQKVFEKDMPSFEDRNVLEKKIIVRFVNAEGQDAARFYTPSLNEKATLVKDLKGIFGSKFAIPAEFDAESLVGQQVQLFISEGQNGKGETTAKITSVMKPAAGQNVPLPTSDDDEVAAPKPVAAKAPAKSTASSKAKAALKKSDDAALAGTEITDDDIPF